MLSRLSEVNVQIYWYSVKSIKGCLDKRLLIMDMDVLL